MASNRLISWNPSNSEEFVQYDSNRNRLEFLSLHSLENQGRQTRQNFFLEAHSVTSLDWQYSNSNSILAYGTSSGVVSLVKCEERVEKIFGAKRPCTCISWNQVKNNYLALGFEAVKGNDSSMLIWDIETDRSLKIPYLESCCSMSWMASGGHDSLLVVGNAMGWIKFIDIRSNTTSSVISVLTHPSTRPRKIKGIRTCPLDGNIFATFSDAAGDIVKVWDLRHILAADNAPSSGMSSSSSQKINSALSPGLSSPSAHGGKVNVSSVFSVNPYITTSLSGGSPGMINDVAWSWTRGGVMAIATSCQKNISFYRIDTDLSPPSSNAANISSTPLFSIDTPESVKSLSWQRGSRIELEDISSFNDKDAYLAPSGSWDALDVEFKEDFRDYSYKSTKKCDELVKKGHIKRLLCATLSGVFETDVRDDMPFSLSWQTMAMLNLGAQVALKPVNPKSFASIGKYLEDVDQIARDRVSVGYSANIRKNKEILLEEVSTFRKYLPAVSEDVSRFFVNLQSLYRVWDWIERVEQLGHVNPTLNLLNCGALEIWKVSMASQAKRSEYDTHLRTGAGFYSSPVRSKLRKLCGWQEKMLHSSTSCDTEKNTELITILESLKSHSIERAAVIALWSGDVEICVQILLDEIQQSISNGKVEPGIAELDHPMTTDYIQLLTMVATCYAGYQAQDFLEETQLNDSSMSMSFQGQGRTASSSWRKMCKHVISRLEKAPRKAALYLIAGCKFLMANEFESSESTKRSKDLYFEFLSMNNYLAVEDKLGFAATYLDDVDLSQWLESSVPYAQGDGALEDLLLTGLSKSGVPILQRHVDTTGDFQSVTLILTRVLHLSLDKGNDIVKQKAIQSLHDYRIILNKWELFVERAQLDVELGQLLNHYKEKFKEIKSNIHKVGFVNKGSAGFSRSSTRSRSDAVLAFTPFEGIAKTVVSQMQLSAVKLKCNFCNTGLPYLEIHNCSEDLREQRNTLNYCTECKKQLPKCYICQLHLGIINPYQQLMRLLEESRSSQKSKASSTSSSSSNGSDQSKGISNNGTAAAATSTAENGTSLSADSGFESLKLKPEQWLIVCQRCRHGGHASCVKSWFSSQTLGEIGSEMKQVYSHRMVCGVNGCDCECRLDFS